ncbi:MAG: hypothetical protein IKJ91_04415 [Clostridia bacterium]|nr:hypothetical protein [Clostridia bacterium]
MDKFANEDDRHRDAEEYVAIQAGIDDCKGKDIFVFATVNNISKLPSSLTRSGRFDRKIEISSPCAEDAENIIKHYLRNKKLDESVNFDDVVKMISYNSCAELETIINEAAINAAFERQASISMKNFTDAILKMQYDAPGNSFSKVSEEEVRKVALHEAGHLVVSEVLNPESVGLASIRSFYSDATGGFVHACKKLKHPSHDVLISLAGKAAVELYYPEYYAEGCQRDLNRASVYIKEEIITDASRGFNMLDIHDYDLSASASYLERCEATIYAELERYMMKTKEILIKNRDFLEKITDALCEKETLLFSDIRMICESSNIIAVNI